MLLGKCGEITPERMKWLGQGRNDAQLQMCLVVMVKPSAVKSNIACMFMCILYMCACLYDYMYSVCIYMHVCIRLYMCIYVFWGRIAVYHSGYPATLHSFSSEVFQDCDTRGRLINPAKCGEGKTWGSLTANSRESRLNLRGEGTF